MPSTISPAQFVKKWSQIQLKESASSQSHFNDICALVGHKPPMAADPKGEFFTFQADAEKGEGERGWADAWYKGRFVWEYKGPQKNLEAAYQQLLRYKDSLGNPPLLITSDTQVIEIHTNFTNTVKKTYAIRFGDIVAGPGLEMLQAAFLEPEKLKPTQTQEQVTQATAKEFLDVAAALRKWTPAGQAALSGEQLAHFLIRLLFCLFAEDIRLLPNNVFTRLVHAELNERQFEQSLRELFAAMRSGGMFGFHPIANFDGGLFDSDFVPADMPSDVMHALRRASDTDWSNIDPSIVGTLFERIIDESKRAQLGAHYTSKNDILLVVEPVLMQPLRERWQDVKQQAAGLVARGAQGEAATLLGDFSSAVASTRVLDPACGSGNFLYLALRQLLDMQKEIIVFAEQCGLPEMALTVGPQQIHGIEINPFAHELAQTTVWIGYLQWRNENGFAAVEEPILRPLQQIELKDAIIDLSDPSGAAKEPAWPDADVIIGNPPFLGDKKMRSELGDQYVDALRTFYADRIPGQSDLVCYWFEKARAQIEGGKAGRAGLLGTQGIRGGANRTVLERIKESGDIFWAQSDRNWIQDGAMVHVSMIGFDDGSEVDHVLDSGEVSTINADLGSAADTSSAEALIENQGISFIGTQKSGPFDLTHKQAVALLADRNVSGKMNRDVVKPWMNALDITGRPRNMWIIDFGTETSREEASKYESPFHYVEGRVKPIRDHVRRKNHREKWWLFGETRPGMRKAISRLTEYIATPLVSKHRMFVRIPVSVIPENLLVVIARQDDYFLGILHSRVHELWSRKMGTQLREAESGQRYTPTTTFETFPFPWPPGKEAQDEPRVQAIAAQAKHLDDMRNGWLNPPEAEIGVTISQSMLKKRTLTNLYNALTLYREKYKGRQRLPQAWKDACGGIIGLDEIETLDHIHTALDHAVFDAYGWPHNPSDEQILERLLKLNLERSHV